MKKLLISLLVLLAISCKSDTEIAASHEWKFGKGTMYLGDWIKFNANKDVSGLYLDNDTIYSGDKPVALVNNISFYIDHYRLEISSLDEKEKGEYIEKGDAKPTE